MSHQMKTCTPDWRSRLRNMSFCDHARACQKRKAEDREGKCLTCFGQRTYHYASFFPTPFPNEGKAARTSPFVTDCQILVNFQMLKLSSKGISSNVLYDRIFRENFGDA